MNDELEQRVAERTETLQRRQTRIAQSGRQYPDILTRFDRNLRYVFVNMAIEKATGQPRDSFYGCRCARPASPIPCAICGKMRFDLYSRQKNPPRSSLTSRARTVCVRFATRLVPELAPAGQVEHHPGADARHNRPEAGQGSPEESRPAERRIPRDPRPRTSKPPRTPAQRSRSAQHVAGPGAAIDTRKMMDRQLSHMVRLIDDLLDASRITNDKLTSGKSGYCCGPWSRSPSRRADP